MPHHKMRPEEEAARGRDSSLSPCGAREDQITRTVQAVENSGPELGGDPRSKGNQTGSLADWHAESSKLGNESDVASQSGGEIVRTLVDSVGEDCANSKRWSGSSGLCVESRQSVLAPNPC